MKIGVEIEHRKAIAIYREALGNPRAYPLIPEGCNTYWAPFQTLDGLPAVIINQRGIARQETDGDEELSGCSVAIALDAPNLATGRATLDAWVREMLPEAG